MPFVFVVCSLIAGAFVGWMSWLGGIWFTMPIFLICAAIVSISLGSEFRWRLAAFSLGLLTVLALEAGEIVRGVNEAQQQAHQGEVRLLKQHKPNSP